MRYKIETIMATMYNQSLSRFYGESMAAPSFFRNFFSWCKVRQANRLLWLGIALAGHGCILTPVTIMAVVFAGTNLVLFILALIAMAMTLVTNLAAMPTKITIPVFAFSNCSTSA